MSVIVCGHGGVTYPYPPYAWWWWCPIFGGDTTLGGFIGSSGDGKLSDSGDCCSSNRKWHIHFTLLSTYSILCNHAEVAFKLCKHCNNKVYGGNLVSRCFAFVPSTFPMKIEKSSDFFSIPTEKFHQVPSSFRPCCHAQLEIRLSKRRA